MGVFGHLGLLLTTGRALVSRDSHDSASLSLDVFANVLDDSVNCAATLLNLVIIHIS